LKLPWLLPGSDTEADAGAGRRCQNLARHLPLCFLGEIQPAAMHRNEDVWVQLADLADNLREVIHRCGTKVEAAHDSVNLLDTRYFHRLAHGIHDANVAAGADDNETIILQVKTGRVLMNVPKAERRLESLD
jgi:hypothetical protein